MGLYVQNYREPVWPFALAPYLWEKDTGKADIIEKNPGGAAIWTAPAPDSTVSQIIAFAAYSDLMRRILEEAIRQWTLRSPAEEVIEVMHQAGWTRPTLDMNFIAIGNIKDMEEGPEKQRLLAQAQEESLRFFQKCMMNFKADKQSFSTSIMVPTLFSL